MIKLLLIITYTFIFFSTYTSLAFALPIAGDLRGHIMYPNGNIDINELYKLTDGDPNTYVDLPSMTYVYTYLEVPNEPEPQKFAELQSFYVDSSSISSDDCVDVGLTGPYYNTYYVPYNHKDKLINMTDYVNVDDVGLDGGGTSRFTIYNNTGQPKRVYEIDIIIANDGYVTDYVPSSPTGLTVDGITATSATAHWNSVSGATSYKVYLDGVNIGTVSDTDKVISGLDPSTTYQVTVSAVNSNGEGLKCTPVSFTTEDLPPPPPEPTEIFIDNITTTSATAHWSSVSGATSYNVYLDGVKIDTVTGTSKILNGLDPSTSYQVSVSAVNEQGEGNKCTPVSFTTDIEPPAPPEPTGLVIDNITTTSATAHWNSVSGATSYNVYLDGVKIDTVTGTSKILNGLDPSTSYQASVSAVNEQGEGNKCTPVSFTTNDEPIWTPLPGTGMGFSVDTANVFDNFKFIFGMVKGSIFPFAGAFLGLFTLALLWKIWRKVAR